MKPEGQESATEAIKKLLAQYDIDPADLMAEGEWDRVRKVSPVAPPASKLPVVEPRASGVLARALLMFSRNTQKVTAWMMKLCVTTKSASMRESDRKEKIGALVRSQISNLQQDIKKQVVPYGGGVCIFRLAVTYWQGAMRPSEEDTEGLLKALRDHNLQLPEDVAPEGLLYLSPIVVRSIFNISSEYNSNVPYGAELAARIFRTWSAGGTTAMAGVGGAVHVEFQTAWTKLDYLTPLSWAAIPRKVKEHACLVGVS